MIARSYSEEYHRPEVVIHLTLLGLAYVVRIAGSIILAILVSLTLLAWLAYLLGITFWLLVLLLLILWWARRWRPRRPLVSVVRNTGIYQGTGMAQRVS